MAQKPKEQDAGWFEILHRNADAAALRVLGDLVPADYEMAMHLVPGAEFVFAEQVLKFYSEDREGIRAFQEFDVLNYFRVKPTVGCRTWLVIAPRRLRAFEYVGGTWSGDEEKDPLVLLKLPTELRFYPFHIRRTA